MMIRAVSLRVFPRLFLATAALILGMAASASAHAVLERSTPAHGSVFPVAPARLEVWFNEPIDPRLITLTLVHNKTRTVLEPLSGVGRRLTYQLPSLPAGLYTVDWRVLSTVDGHLTRGAFSFGAGTVSVPATIGAASTAGPSWTEVAARWVGLIGIFLLIGSTVAFFWLPTPHAAEAELRHGLHRLAVAAAAGILASGLFRVLENAAAIEGSASLADVTAGTLIRVLAESHSGHDLIFRSVAAIFMALMLRPDAQVERQGFLAMTAVLLIGPVLTTHGPTTGVIGIVIATLHIAGASVWVGGLAYFGGLYLPTVRRLAPEAVPQAAVKFSRLALVSVGALIATGIAQSYLYLGSPAALLGSGYGRTLLVKLIVLAPLLAFAAINRWGIVPRLVHLTGLWRSLLVVVRLETALGISLALVAAAVAIREPATSAQTQPPAGNSKLILGGTIGDVSLAMTIAPAALGPNTVDIVGKQPDGTALAGEVRYLVGLRALGQDIAPTTSRLDTRDGSASGQGLFITAPGWWSLHVTVRRRGVEDATLVLPLLIDTPSTDASEAPALRLLVDAERLAGGVRAWQEREYFSPGDGPAITREYVFAVPDRLAYRTSLGTEGRMIGTRSFVRDPGGAWSMTERPEAIRVAFRFPLATGTVGARLGIRVEEGGRTYQIVTYADPSGKLHFATWIDLATGLPARLFMVGEAHYMAAEFFNYGQPVEIAPP
jgi:copper transport protein